MSLKRVRSTGTVNHVFRLGESLQVRVPRYQEVAADLDKELRLLPRLAPLLSLRVPEPVARGDPDADVPVRWAVYRWLDGTPYDDALVTDEVQAAINLAEFVKALRAVDPVDAPPAGRAPLRTLDEATREALLASDGIDVAAAVAAWDRAVESAAWDGLGPVWIHADLLRPNLLVVDGRIDAVLDWGSAGIGDPAADVIAAWSVFRRAGRRAFLAALEVDDETIERAKGFAVTQSALIIPYYTRTNPGLAAHARRTIAEVIDDNRG